MASVKVKVVKVKDEAVSHYEMSVLVKFSPGKFIVSRLVLPPYWRFKLFQSR